MYKIVRKETLNDAAFEMEIEAPMVARKCEAGQFIILRVGEDGERIPLTIGDFDRDKGTITIVVQAVGFSTKQLEKLEVGDEVTDFVGPRKTNRIPRWIKACCWRMWWYWCCTSVSTA